MFEVSWLFWSVQGDDLKGSLWRFIVCYSKGEWSEAEGQK